jgi:hypothetical protein
MRCSQGLRPAGVILGGRDKVPKPSGFTPGFQGFINHLQLYGPSNFAGFATKQSNLSFAGFVTQR